MLGAGAAASPRPMSVRAQPISTTSSAIALRDRQAVFTSLFFLLATLGARRHQQAAWCASDRQNSATSPVSVMTTGSSVNIGASLQEGLRRPDETNSLFVDHMMLALTAHVAQTYGGLKPGRGAEPRRPRAVAGKRACDRLESDLNRKVAFAADRSRARPCRSATSHARSGFPPACRRINGLLRQRVKAAKQLMTVRDLPLSEIAMSAGFANQSHFIHAGVLVHGRRQPGRVAP